MKETVLKATGLTKRYKDFTALDGADLTVYRGDIYGLIGRNGAGKTTLMKTVTGLTAKSDGEYEIFGKSGAAAEAERGRIGCLIENPAFFGNMTAFQNLRYYCCQKGIADISCIDKVLGLVQLTEAKNKKFKTFSLGMKQRLGIAFAMLDNPDLLILDEPINGLDPIGISELRDTFRRLNSESSMTIMISSHILSELYAVADRFLFIDRGKVLKEMTKEDLDLECSRCVSIKTDDTKSASVVLENELGISDYKVISSNEIRVYEKGADPSIIVRAIVNKGIAVFGLSESGISLEDYYKQLVGEV